MKQVVWNAMFTHIIITMQYYIITTLSAHVLRKKNILFELLLSLILSFFHFFWMNKLFIFKILKLNEIQDTKKKVYIDMYKCIIFFFIELPYGCRYPGENDYCLVC